MKVSVILVPYVIRKWQEDPQLNPEGKSLEEMLSVHAFQLRNLDFPDHIVESLEAEAMQLMIQDQIALGRQEQIA